MGYIAQLERGPYKIKFDGTGVCRLAPDFKPPTINLVPNVAYGTSANRYDGGVVIGERLNPTEITIPFHMVGTSDKQLNAEIDRINTFLREAGGVNPTLFSWLSSDAVPYTPQWGQGTRKLVITSGYAVFGDNYGVSNLRDRAVANCALVLSVDSILGNSQLLASAKGGVMEDLFCVEDGVSRGTIIARAITNLHTRPQGTGFTATHAGTGGYVNKVADKSLHGFDFVWLLSAGSGTTRYTQNITFTSTEYYTTSFFAKKADGSAVTADDVIVGLSAGATYTYYGNGWYRVHRTQNLPGGGAVACGPTVLSNKSVYVQGFQTEQNGVSGNNNIGAGPTPLCIGDFPGCAWTGDPWDSTSTRVDGVYKIPNEKITHGVGSVEITFVPGFTAIPPQYEDQYIFSARFAIEIHYDVADTRWEMSDGGTNTIVSAADVAVGVFGTPVTLHATWGNGTMTLYRDGVQIATGNYRNSTTIDYPVFIGTRDDGATTYCANMVLQSCNIYEQKLTAAQVLGDYTRISKVSLQKRNVSRCPYIHTLGAANILYGYNDSTHNDFCHMAGIPGDMPAKTIFDLTAGADEHQFVVASWKNDQYLNPYLVSSSATSTVSVTLGETFIKSVGIGFRPSDIDYYGRNAYIIVFMTDAGSNLQIKMTLTGGTGLGDSYSTEYKAVNPGGGGGGVYILGPLSLIDGNVLPGDASSMEFGARLFAKRTVSGAADVAAIETRMIFDGYGRTTETSVGANVMISGRNGYENVISSMTLLEQSGRQYVGKSVDLFPNKYNHIVVWATAIGDSGVLDTYTTVTGVYVTPRYLTV